MSHGLTLSGGKGEFAQFQPLRSWSPPLTFGQLAHLTCFDPMIQIRQCRSEDFGVVMQLLRQLWPEKHLDSASVQAVFERALASEQQAYLCATDGERVVGFGSLTLKNNLWQEGFLAHVDELVVDSGYRGRGIGSQLLDQLMFLAQQRGCRRVELDSAFHRKEAHQFYERRGFESRAFLFSKVL